MPELTFSFIIVCKDEERVIKRCIDAIQNVMEKHDELIIVDTGSTDNTLKIINNLYKNIKLVNHKWNDDFSKARNEGIRIASKDWIFFIDSDEILQPIGLKKFKEEIIELEKKYFKPVVFSPKIKNVDDSIVYNSGRIIKNNGDFTFFGRVHEYPIYLGDIRESSCTTIALTDVSVTHDGYLNEVMINKQKSMRNINLIKKMLNEYPNNERYHFFYCRDSREIVDEMEYENGLVEFVNRFPESGFLKEVYKELIRFHLTKGNTDETEKYLEYYWELIKNKDDVSKSELIYLTTLNEIQKIHKVQMDLLDVLVDTKNNLHLDSNRLVDSGYCFDDLIGYLYFNVGNYKEAKKINDTLTKNNYLAILNQLLVSIERGSFFEIQSNTTNIY